jgi:energy-coupling factor transporter ATPase
VSAPRPTLIEVTALSHTYLRGTPLATPSLHRVDFVVSRQDVIGVIGPTGSGKSTLLQHLNGLLRPQEGEVEVDGIRLSDLSVDVRSIRQKVGLLFQSPEDQLFERYAGDDVAFGPRRLGLSDGEVRIRVKSAMEAVGLGFDLRDRLTLDLSYGQRRRLAIAGVLALQPDVLALDEPMAGLDAGARTDLAGILRDWVTPGNRAVIIATHDMDEVVELCNYVYIMDEGRIVAHGDTRDVFLRTDLLQIRGVGLPQGMTLAASLRNGGIPLPDDCMTSTEVADAVVAYLKGKACGL